MSAPTLEKVIELVNQLSPEDRHRIVEHIHTLEEETEDAADARAVLEAYGDALNPDGSIDFDKLYAQGSASGVELHHEYPNIFDEDGHFYPEEDWGEDE